MLTNSLVKTNAGSTFSDSDKESSGYKAAELWENDTSQCNWKLLQNQTLKPNGG